MTPLQPPPADHLHAYVTDSIREKDTGRACQVRRIPHLARERGRTLSALLIETERGWERYVPDGLRTRAGMPLCALTRRFDLPEVSTLRSAHPEAYGANLRTLSEYERGWQFYPAQKECVARMALRSGVLLSAEVGAGKTLMGLSFCRLHGARRVLVIAPQGTVRGPKAQWAAEVRKFWPGMAVHVLDGMFHVEQSLPDGVYLTWPQVYFQRVAPKLPADCWDAAVVDEIHQYRNLRTIITQGLHALSVPVRCAMTATPVYDTAKDLFPLCGWAAGWGSDEFPYGYHQREKFEQEHLRGGIGPEVVDVPTLAKLIAPFTARITKRDCRADMPEMTVNVHRIPMAEEQARVYRQVQRSRSWELNVPNQVRVRITKLRGVCASPSRFLRTASDRTAKNRRIAEHILERVAQGHPVLYIGARLAQADAIEGLLAESGVKCARIDANRTAANHAKEAELFTSGKRPVLLMGIKCAQAYSFAFCRHVVIGSWEWTSGSWDQALGRAFRVSSEGDVEVDVFVCDATIEVEMLERVMSKDATARAVLSGEGKA